MILGQDAIESQTVGAVGTTRHMTERTADHGIAGVGDNLNRLVLKW